MLFLAAVTFLLYATGIASYREKDNFFLRGAYYLTGLFGGFAVLTGMEFHLNPEKGIPGDAINYSVYLFGALGFGSVALFSSKLARILRSKAEREGPSWRYGISLWAICVGLYLCFTVVDHMWFFRDPSNSGIASASAMGAEEIKCESMVLVRFTDKTAVYRCPRNFVWGKSTDRPFVPWPAYAEGDSDVLKKGYDDMQRNAIRAN